MAADMKFTAKISGDCTEILLRQWQEQSKPIQDVVRSAALSLQTELRAQVRNAGLGNGLANAWQMLPPANKFKWAALVYSKAVRLHEAFNASETVKAKNGSWLALPTVEAVRLGLAQDVSRSKSGSVARRWSNVEAAIRRFGKLKFIALRSGQGLLVAPQGKGQPDIPLFILVPSVHEKKVLDIEGATKRAFTKLKSDLQQALKA